MGRPYSLGLRERVVDAAAATSRRQAAARFGVGIATAIRWAAAVEATGTVAARPQGRPRTSKLDPHEAFLCGLIDGQDDITLEEMRARLLAECDLKVGLGTLWALRGPNGARDEFHLAAAAQNLRKLTKLIPLQQLSPA